jgi:hypothetical protein
MTIEWGEKERERKKAYANLGWIESTLGGYLVIIEASPADSV